MSTMETKGGSNEPPTFTLSRRPKVAVAAAKKKKVASKSRRRSSNSFSRMKIPIPSFQTDELERLEKDFLEDDEPPSKRLVPSKKSPASGVPTLELSDDDDDNDLLLTAPVFASRTKVSATSEKREPTMVAKEHHDNDCHDLPLDDDASTERSTPLDAHNHAEGSIQAPVPPPNDQGRETRNSPELTDQILVTAVHKLLASKNLESFTLRQLVQSLEQEMKTTLTKSQRKRVREICQQQQEEHSNDNEPQPDLVSLYRVVDRVFQQGQFDVHTMTIKPVLATIQREFAPVVFTKATRERVKERLADWVQTRMQDAHATRLYDDDALQPLHEQENESQASNTNMDGCKVDMVVKASSLQKPLPKPIPPPPKPAAPKPPAPKPPAHPEVVVISESAPTKPPKPRRTRARKTELAEGTAAVTRKRPRAPPRVGGNCQLCRNCPCTTADACENGAVVATLARTDAGVERALIKRLEKLERVSERYEDQTDAVRRKLKKHRREMFLKWEAANPTTASSSTVRSRFLPDADELEQSSVMNKEVLPRKKVARAQGQLFDFAPSYQPTLTQMFGTSKKSNDDTLQLEDDQDGQGEGLNATMAIQEADGNEPEGQEFVQSPEVMREVGETNQEEEEEAFALKSEAVPAHRIDWQDGTEQEGETAVATSGNSIWGSLLSGRFSSAWDRLFEDQEEVENLGVDHLVGMFGPTQQEKEEFSVASPPSPVRTDMLSQRAKGLAATIVGRIEADEDKVKALELACPNWRENVAFAMYQRDRESVNEALESVGASRAKLERVRAEMLQLMERQEAALDVFEDALRQSRERMETETVVEPETHGFFMSQVQATSPAGRPSFQSEVATLVPSGTLFDDLASDTQLSPASYQSPTKSSQAS